jgi:dihydroflavonol-4-reductase
MSRALVTGGTGFVGSHVVCVLRDAGFAVRALVRWQSGGVRRNPLPDGIEPCWGDLRDPEAVRRAVRGCDAVFHVAADYRLWASDPSELRRTNVEGTSALLTEALRQGVERVVYTSTVAAVGIPADGTPGTETSPVAMAQLVGAYKQSKYAAEQEALRLAQAGLPVVIVNPSTPVGPGDVKPTPTGKIILDFLRGRMPAYVDTGLNLIAVEDVARGHLLAYQKGRVGERYILGNRNMTLREILTTLAAITGRRAPRWRLPYHLALGIAYADEWFVGRVLGRVPDVPVDAVHMARRHMYFDATKAVRELGLPQTPVEDALARAVAWFYEQGYVS